MAVVELRPGGGNPSFDPILSLCRSNSESAVLIVDRPDECRKVSVNSTKEVKDRKKYRRGINKSEHSVFTRHVPSIPTHRWHGSVAR